MCVIIVKPANVKLPNKHFLEMAAEANPDGFGYATSRGVYFRTLDFEEFYEHLRLHVRKCDDVIIHFRWATHGSVKPENCHPFKGEAAGKEVIFAHNGVLPIDSKNDMTDSEICFRERILPWLDSTNGRMTQDVKAAIRRECGSSRFAFLTDDGLTTFGYWEQYRGLLLSNTRFMWLGWQRTRIAPSFSYAV